jgi:hypothetical protein
MLPVSRGSVPGQAEILSVDLCDCTDRDSGVAPGILRRWRWPFHRKPDLAGNAMDGQVAFDRQLSIPDGADTFGFEVQGRELFYTSKKSAVFR